MRELKFRLIKDDKIVGYELFLDGKWVYAYPEGNFNINIPYIEHDYKEQFTGLKDQNGVEIYEGEILLSQAYTDKPHSKKVKSKRFHVVVKWDNKNAKFYSCRNNIDIYRYGQWGDFFDVRIVGNIHMKTCTEASK